MTFCSLINGRGKETIALELGVTARMCQLFGPGGANMHSPPGEMVDSICRLPGNGTTAAWWPVHCIELGLNRASEAEMGIGGVLNEFPAVLVRTNLAWHRC
jgi:hypothetical protein